MADNPNHRAGTLKRVIRIEFIQAPRRKVGQGDSSILLECGHELLVESWRPIGRRLNCPGCGGKQQPGVYTLIK